MAVWVLLCLAVALSLHDKPFWMLTGGLVLWTLVPGVAGVVLTGRSTGLLALHPATWFILACFAVLLVRRPRELLTEVAGRWPLYLVLLFVVLAAAIMSLQGSEPPGLVLVIDQILGPVLLFWFAAVAIRREAAARDRLRTLVVGLAAGEALLTIAQYALHQPILWGARFRTNYWFTPAWDRWMGTTDHPLVLSLLLCAAAPLVAGFRRAWVQVALLVLMAVAVLITQSRTAAGLFPLAVLYVVFRSRARAAAKLLLAAAVVAGGFAVLTSPLVDGLQSRLVDDTGSTDARGRALQFFLEQYQRFIVFGDGITTSYKVAKVGGLSTSLESAFLMYAVGIGLITTVLYFGAQIVVTLSALGTARVRGVLVSSLMVLVIPQTFSSLGVVTLCGPLLWVVLALAASGRLPSVRDAAAEQEPRAPDRQALATSS